MSIFDVNILEEIHHFKIFLLSPFLLQKKICWIWYFPKRYQPPSSDARLKDRKRHGLRKEVKISLPAEAKPKRLERMRKDAGILGTKNQAYKWGDVYCMYIYIYIYLNISYIP